MIRNGLAVLALTALAPLLMPAQASANDTQANVAMGGLIFEKNDEISMDSEDLFLSLDQVRVKYRYTNHSAEPITLLVAFPLPEVPLHGADWDWVEAAYPDWDDIGMKTMIGGVEAELTRLDIPRVNGEDVERRIRQEGWPLRFWEDPGLNARLAQLATSEKATLIAEGLLTDEGMGPGEVRPAWTVQTSFVRLQRFAPHETVTVEHHYTPWQGGTVASGLDHPAREATLGEGNEYRQRYCVDDAFLRDYDAVRYREGGRLTYSELVLESWISYLLSPGANWHGVIEEFSLTIDTGTPDRIVSTCMPGLTKVGPATFTVTRKYYEPDRDLHLLFVEIVPMEGPN